jgi:hypothetical protein
MKKVTNCPNNLEFSKFIVINHKGKKYIMFKFIIRLFCLFSSYLYAYLAAFRIKPEYTLHKNNILNLMMIVNEFIFLIDFLTKFFLSFTD